MITVHHLDHSRSQRVLWLLEELGQPYELVRYQRDPQTLLAPQALKAVHPLGKLPVVVLDDGLVLAESAAILETLVERFSDGRLTPSPGSPEALRHRYWMHYSEGSAMPPLLLKLVFDRIGSRPMPFFARPIINTLVDKVRATLILPQLETHLDFMESALEGRDWFCGPSFTAADIQMSFPVEAARSRAGLDDSRPRLIAWLARIHARPAYQRAEQRGGPAVLPPS